ncbi:uncharacterized protein [Dermacentor albipictus]|uniref:uncharacterized protein isoform X2 n=1 Tax=Dermacentor albipictus TaxID=60249 RepID=UPI0038FC4569
MAGANVIPVLQKAVATPAPPAAVPPPIRPAAVTIPAAPKPPAPIVPPQPDAARVAPNAGDGMRRDHTTWMGTKGQPVPSSWFFSMHDR